MKQWNWIKEHINIIALSVTLLGGVFWAGNAQANINTLKETNIELVVKVDKQREQTDTKFDKIDTKLDNIMTIMTSNHSDVNSRLAVIEDRLNIKK